uniref:Uncharacterized protein n=1 Tax=Oryza brachyantha TaxID=4533 RepID=J3N0B8_ORYBR
MRERMMLVYAVHIALMTCLDLYYCIDSLGSKNSSTATSKEREGSFKNSANANQNSKQASNPMTTGQSLLQLESNPLTSCLAAGRPGRYNFTANLAKSIVDRGQTCTSASRDRNFLENSELSGLS